MKHARIAWAGAIHHAIQRDGRLELLTPGFKGRLLDFNDVVWLPPLAPMPPHRPRTVLALAINYADHAKELAFKPPEEPLAFAKGAASLIGHRAFTVRPDGVQNMHYECELAVVIGREARHVKRGNAYDFVRGYTVANDYAIRDYLENWYRPNLRVKNRDTCTPIGPWLVDAADVPDPMKLQLRTTVNCSDAAGQHARHGVRCADFDRILQQLHDAVPRRSDPDRHARRRGRLPGGQPRGVRDRRHRGAGEHHH